MYVFSSLSPIRAKRMETVNVLLLESWRDRGPGSRFDAGDRLVVGQSCIIQSSSLAGVGDGDGEGAFQLGCACEFVDRHVPCSFLYILLSAERSCLGSSRLG